MDRLKHLTYYSTPQNHITYLFITVGSTKYWFKNNGRGVRAVLMAPEILSKQCDFRPRSVNCTYTTFSTIPTQKVVWCTSPLDSSS